MTKWSLDEIMHTGVKKREGCIRQLSSYDLLDRIRAMVFLSPPPPESTIYNYKNTFVPVSTFFSLLSVTVIE